MIAGTLAVLLILFGGGHGGTEAVVLPEHFEQRLEQAIAEPARAGTAVAEWKALQKGLETYTKDLKKLQERMEEADDAPGTGAAAIDSMLAGFAPTRRAAQQRTFDRLFAMRGAMTREEWAGLFQGEGGAGAK
jgi:hypothetical protein